MKAAYVLVFCSVSAVLAGESMKGKAAGQGSKIMINSLATFIEEELPKLTYKKWGYEQIPQKTLQGMDFQIGIR